MSVSTYMVLWFHSLPREMMQNALMVALVMYIVTFSSGMGPITWTVNAEKLQFHTHYSYSILCTLIEYIIAAPHPLFFNCSTRLLAYIYSY